MESVPDLLVDFNNDDDDDVIRALRKHAPNTVVPGQPLRLYDREGNKCLGYVVSADAKFVNVKPEWSTWIDANPVRLSKSPDLDVFLVGLVRDVKPQTSNEVSGVT